MVNVQHARWHDYIRFVFSAILLLFSLIVTSYAIVMQKTSFFEAVPGWAALLLFIFDLILLGIVEGLQIALVELKRQHPDSYQKSHPAAYRLGQLAARGDNVERFLMGRQVSVVILVFFAAKLTTIHATDADDSTFLFPVPGWVQASFFETGFIACITVVILAQLLPQIVAAQYPVHFLQFCIMRPSYYFCVFVEITGITHICWVLAYAAQKAAHMEDDSSTRNPVEADIEDLPSITVTVDQLHGSLDKKTEEEDVMLERNASATATYEGEKEVTGLIAEQFSRFSELVDTLNQNVTPETLKILSQYLDSHPEKFSKFPSVIGNKMYPAPGALAECFRRDGLPVPRFLTDIGDSEHIPPHIVACELIAKNKHLQEEIYLLNMKMNSIRL